MAMPWTFPQVGQTLSWWMYFGPSLTTLPETSPLGWKSDSQVGVLDIRRRR